ncbi:hypothetical protein Psta_1017 [Pirellula staleyi DSM 6068]|uniref:Leucine Rich repeats (2 copies) n=1 Tax=Pirellula staleyi (strain ATCC 27377 / DSM 6068 / ICPB 4128) TaxID=530564 RepID=D2R884_PIRSD|nr:hypothetical protein [Pirellula staleyi]ADB15701.1 hypothetical protein Psta_1017 [Pirellula staleyi DSM 6068]
MRIIPRLRFSLRTLLILTTLVAAGLGYFCWFEAPAINLQQREQEAFCDELLTNPPFFESMPDWEELPQGPLGQLLGRKRGRRLMGLDLLIRYGSDDASKVVQGFELIERHKGLNIRRIVVQTYNKKTPLPIPARKLPKHATEIYLQGIILEAELLHSLGEQKNLTHLFLDGCPFRTNDLKESNRQLWETLRPPLDTLDVRNMELSAQSCSQLSHLPHLKFIKFDHCEFVAQTGALSKRVPAEALPASLGYLRIERQELDAAFFAQLKHCTKLLGIHLPDCRVSDIPADQVVAQLLPQLPREIELLTIPAWSATADDIRAAARFNQLKWMSITNTGKPPAVSDVEQLSDRLEFLDLKTDQVENWIEGLRNRPASPQIRIEALQPIPADVVQRLVDHPPTRRFEIIDRKLDANSVDRLRQAGVWINLTPPSTYSYQPPPIVRTLPLAP